jgi:hypothetical protein
MVDMPEELAGVLLEVAWLCHRFPASCRFNRLNGHVNPSGWRRRGTLIAVENCFISSNVAVMSTRAL